MLDFVSATLVDFVRGNMRLLLKPIFAAALLAVIAAALACGEQGPPPTPTPTPIDPQALLDRTARAVSEVNSFHFVLSHPKGGTPMLDALLIHDGEGDIVKPDKLSVEFGGVFGNIYITASFIGIEGQSYMTNPFSGNWEIVPSEVNPIAFFSPEKGLSAIIAGVHNPTLISSDQDNYRVGGLLPPQALASFFGETIHSEDEADFVSVELTLDAESYLLVGVKLDGRITDGEPPGTVREIAVSGFDEPVEIEPPL